MHESSLRLRCQVLLRKSTLSRPSLAFHIIAHMLFLLKGAMPLLRVLQQFPSAEQANRLAMAP